MCGWFLQTHEANGRPAKRPQRDQMNPGTHSCFMTDSSLFCLPFMTRLPRWGSGKESTCQFRRSKVSSLNLEDLLEEEMETHSSTFTWKIPCIEEPGRLQSTESQRVGHDWATSLHVLRKIFTTMQSIFLKEASYINPSYSTPFPK